MKALIIGGGIGGLTTGIALEQIGVETEIYEASLSIQPVGAGIWMAPNAMQVFDRLGFADQVMAQGMPLDRIEITDQYLETIQRMDQLRIKQEFGFTVTSIARHRLLDVLLNSYPGTVHLDKRLESYDQEADEVYAHFADGSSAHGDLLIGADGIHSTVRDQLTEDSATRYSGQTCWRGIAEISLSDQLAQSCIEAWGHAYRLGFSVISEREVYWFAVAKATQGEQGKDKSELTTMFNDYAAPIPEIIAATPATSIIRNDISDLKPISTWHKNRVCMIGDAAHAATPNLGQGGAQAVEDAWVLSQLMSSGLSPQSTFQQFEQARREKVQHVVRTSWLIGKIAHLPFGKSLRNLLMRYSSDQKTHEQLQEIYAIDY
ncbi:MAG: FAD-dependent monooxygenase [Bacteroidota bacterium]